MMDYRQERGRASHNSGTQHGSIERTQPDAPRRLGFLAPGASAIFACDVVEMVFLTGHVSTEANINIEIARSYGHHQTNTGWVANAKSNVTLPPLTTTGMDAKDSIFPQAIARVAQLSGHNRGVPNTTLLEQNEP